MILLIAVLLPRLYFDQPPSTPPPVTTVAVSSAVAADWTKQPGIKVEVVDPAKLTKLTAPKVQYRPNVASATTSPWIDAHGWTLLRHPESQYIYEAPGQSAALAAAEAYAYDANVLIKTDANGLAPFQQMLTFLNSLPAMKAVPVANIGVIDDGTPETGELMNLLSRRNLLYKLVLQPDSKLPVNVALGTKKYPKEAAYDPDTLAHQIRYELTDDRRSLRIYGSEVVIARLASEGSHARVHLINYANRPVRGLRVRVAGAYSKGDLKAFGQSSAELLDFSKDGDATEFTVPEINTYAVIDLSR